MKLSIDTSLVPEFLSDVLALGLAVLMIVGSIFFLFSMQPPYADMSPSEVKVNAEATPVVMDNPPVIRNAVVIRYDDSDAKADSFTY